MRYLTIVAAILLLCLPCRALARQLHVHVHDIDMPVAADTVSQADTLPPKGIINKVIRYFEGSNEDKTFTRKMDFSFIGGPHYSSDVKLGLGLVAAGLYRLDRTDSLTPVSNVSLVGDIATSGFWKLGIRGNNFFRNSVFRIDYDLSFSAMPKDKFWGVGYDMGCNDANETRLHSNKVEVTIDAMYLLARNLYAGVALDFNRSKGRKFSDEAILAGAKKQYTNTGAGLFLLYDSRDSQTAPYKGWYVKLENVIFPGFAGSSSTFNRTALTVDFYHRIWEGGVMAYDLHCEYNDGKAPWTMLARMGGSARMRGYYEGRYRDKGILEAQAELRQKIWRRIGGVVWVGGGNVFSSPRDFDADHILPNGGVGLRWEFKSRVNVRLDFGMGKSCNGVILSINEAF